MIQDLLKICDMESDENEVGWHKRRKAMLQWFSDNVHIVNKEMSVINPNVFTSDNMDIIKEELARQFAEELTTYTDYKISGKTIKASIMALKRPPRG
jgi:hypothetical protein